MRYGESRWQRGPACLPRAQPASRMAAPAPGCQTNSMGSGLKVLKMSLPRNQQLFVKETRFPCTSAEEHHEGWDEDNDGTLE